MTMTHTEASQLLHAAADGLLDQSERAALDAHLAVCAECRALAAELDALQLNLSHALRARWETHPLPADFPRKVLNRVRRSRRQQPLLRIAEALAGGVVLVALAFFFNTLFGEPNMGPGTSPTEAVPSATAALASFDGANGLIAFQSERDGNPEIYVMRADGSGQTNLTNNPAADMAPAWSPDGTRLAFISDRTGRQEVYVMNADGSGVTQLTDSPGSPSFLPPLSWSPDGTRLVAALSPQEDRQGSSEIYLINADGSGATSATSDRFDDFDPKWSPDGQRIAFISLRHTPAVLLSISPGGTSSPGGTRPAILGLEAVRNVASHAWAPDGRRLAYFSTAIHRFGAYRDELRIVNADGSGEKTILTFDRPQRSAYDDLAWSPDGTRLIFASAHENTLEGAQHIYVLWADGSGLTRLTTGPANHAEPRWAPDGKWIAFTSDREASPDIYIMNVTEAMRSPGTLTPIRLTSTGKDHDPQWQPTLAPPTEQAVLPSPAPTPTEPPVIRLLGVHQVQGGETVRCIASAYGVSASAIVDLNQLGNPPQLRRGPLLIPDVKDEPGAGGRMCSPQFASPHSFAPVVTVPAPNTFLFAPAEDGLSARPNFAGAAGCEWWGIGGQAFARNGAPLAGLVVHLEGGGLSRDALTGSKSEYGPGGYEIRVDDHLAITPGAFRVQLRDRRGQPLSDWIPVETFADCSRNLLRVNFAQK